MKLEELSDSDRELVERTTRELDRRPYSTPQDVWRFICESDVKDLMRRRGVDISRMSRKAFRRFRHKVKNVIIDGEDMSVMAPVFKADPGANPAQRIYMTIMLMIEQQIHRGVLPLGANVSAGICGDRECVLGCRQMFQAPEEDRVNFRLAPDEFGGELSPEWTTWPT